MSARLVWLLSVACALAVAANYYAQPLIEAIGVDFGINREVTGLFVTWSQLTYALGLMFIVPLGDLLNNKKLIIILFLLVAAGLALVAVSPNLPSLVVGLTLIGLFCTAAQVIVALAAGLTPAIRRGRVIGIVMSGLLMGILLSRTFAGAVAEAWGWRMVYFLGAAMMVLMSAVLSRELPNTAVNPDRSLSYKKILLSAWDLLKNNQLLRERSILGALDFALFTILWTTLTLLLSAPPYSYNLSVIGLFGLLGAIGVVGAFFAGKFADFGFAQAMTIGSGILFFLSWVLLDWGATAFMPLILGVVLLDFVTQVAHICNQTLIYKSDSALKSRITAAYMTSYFAGGVLGSLASALCYGFWGWRGVSILGMAVSLVFLFAAFKFKTEKF